MSRTIVKDRIATYMIFEPGDGTRYTAFIVEYPDDYGGDSLYVAIGAGDKVKGGYFLRRSNLESLGKDIMTMNEDEQSIQELLLEHHYTNYWQGHLKLNRWTTVVGILLGMVFVLCTESFDTGIDFIGRVYHNDYDTVYGDLLHWSREREKQNG